MVVAEKQIDKEIWELRFDKDSKNVSSDYSKESLDTEKQKILTHYPYKQQQWLNFHTLVNSIDRELRQHVVENKFGDRMEWTDYWGVLKKMSIW